MSRELANAFELACQLKPGDVQWYPLEFGVDALAVQTFQRNLAAELHGEVRVVWRAEGTLEVRVVPAVSAIRYTLQGAYGECASMKTGTMQRIIIRGTVDEAAETSFETHLRRLPGKFEAEWSAEGGELMLTIIRSSSDNQAAAASV